MDKLMEAVLSGSTKRIIGAAVGVALIALNNKFGLGISDAGFASIAVIVGAWVAQSGLAKGKEAGEEAAAKVADVKSAIEVLK